MKEIKFYPLDEKTYHTVPCPKPAINYLPEWYREKKFYDGGKPSYNRGEVLNKTIRSCVPFLDALSYGYVQETWCDIVITYDRVAGPLFHYADFPEPIRLRGGLQMNVTDEFYPLDFVWNVTWFPRLPKGYSVLFTHPFNRYDLPFQSTSGIVDADNFYHILGGSYPFLLKKGFEGLIPKGTPMFQMIPIKRDNWKSSTVEFDPIESMKRRSQMHSYFSGAYRKLFHVKKSFK